MDLDTGGLKQLWGGGGELLPEGRLGRRGGVVVLVYWGVLGEWRQGRGEVVGQAGDAVVQRLHGGGHVRGRGGGEGLEGVAGEGWRAGGRGLKGVLGQGGRATGRFVVREREGRVLGGSVVLVVGGEAVLGRDVGLGGMTREAELGGGIVTTWVVLEGGE